MDNLGGEEVFGRGKPLGEGGQCPPYTPNTSYSVGLRMQVHSLMRAEVASAGASSCLHTEKQGCKELPLRLSGEAGEGA